MIESFFQNFPIPIVTLLGVLILGLISGIVGSFAVLNKQGLLGEGISHASLPGVGIMFIILGTKQTTLMLIGAGIASLIAMMCIIKVVKYTRIKFDATLALVLSSFYGLGIVLKSYIQGTNNARQAGLDGYIFGQVNFILIEDVVTMAICGVIILIITLIYWKQLKLFIFDADYARILGFSSKTFNIVLSLLITLTVVIGLKTVGVILMCALLIAPAVAARQWTNNTAAMVILSALIAMSSGVIGAYIGSVTVKMPTGPLIAVVASCFVLISLLFAPQRGIIFMMVQRMKNKSLYQKKGTSNVLNR